LNVTDETPSKGQVSGSGVELARLNPSQFQRFRDFIYAKSGIQVPDNKVALLSNRIRRRLKAGAFADFDAYYRYLTGRTAGRELEHFFDSITTNETFFFRSPHHFDWLKGEFLHDILKDERRGMRRRSLRIWSAGCATGAEPYTIAICLRENRYRLRDWSLTVLGTDISEEALHDARAGIFRPRALEAVGGTKQLQRCFVPADPEGCWQVRPELKELVHFECHNLMEPQHQAPFDCVFIRNVLIYFDRVSKKTVIAHLIDALSPGGFLVVGPSEGIYDMLDPLERQHTYLYRKPIEGAP
jgi:chemotaxis protein methyltransferase CheR